MAALIDTLSTRKLVAFGVFLLLLQIAFFIIGGTIAPSPSNVSSMTAVKCRDDHKGPADRWFYPRGQMGNQTCKRIYSLHDDDAELKKLSANDVVFAVQFPLPRDNQVLSMSRWFQGILGILQLDIIYVEDAGRDEIKMELEIHARIGYRNQNDPEDAWKEIDRSVESRLLDCSMEDKVDGLTYNCTPMALFELGSSHHDFYLVNLRLPVTTSSNGTIAGKNAALGKLEDLMIIEIHQNGGFTRVWWSVKTVLFPFVLAAIVWFWHRIQQLPKAPRLLEKMLFALGLALLLLDMPVEWLTLAVDMPGMLLMSDIRQGIFYSVLLAFWIIFAGEYQMDDVIRDNIVAYWKHLSAVAFGCVCLFVFDMCERGVQLTNAFYSIWATTTGTNLAMAFIITAGVCACIYFFFLTYMVGLAIRNMWDKRKKLCKLDEKRRKHYQVLIFRFQFLLLITLLCAALTVISFIIGQVSESSLHVGDQTQGGLEYRSAVSVGVYAMWNLYVLALLVLYSPSSSHETLTETREDASEDIVLNRMDHVAPASTEVTSMTSFIRKVAED